jgi:hypothetical protein
VARSVLMGFLCGILSGASNLCVNPLEEPYRHDNLSMDLLREPVRQANLCVDPLWEPVGQAIFSLDPLQDAVWHGQSWWGSCVVHLILV